MVLFIMKVINMSEDYRINQTDNGSGMESIKSLISLDKEVGGGNIVWIDREQKIGSFYVPKGEYVELALVPSLEWSG